MAQLTALHRLALAGNAWYADLPEQVRARIESEASLRSLRNGQCLYQRGERADGWYGILSGAIKVSNTTGDGREVVLTYIEPGSWFGEISLFDGLPRTHDGYAHGQTDILALPCDAFERLLVDHPSLIREFMQLQCKRMRLLFSMVEDMHTLSTEQRLARQLLSLTRSYGRQETQGLLIDLKLPQDELAQLMAVTCQSINKIFKAWERDGWLSQRYGKIVVLNVAALQAQAGFV